MMRKGETGNHVRDFQVKLIQLGYKLPRWGADGDLGDETLGALALFMHEHKGAIPDDRAEVVSDNEIARVNAVLAARTIRPAPRMPVSKFYDSRQQTDRAHDFGPRPWNLVTGILVHQTACHLGEVPARMFGIGAHMVATREANLHLLHSFNRIVDHGNGLNNRCIGLECDGLYAGVKGDPKTVWNDPTTKRVETAMAPTQGLFDVAIVACNFACDEVESHGGRILFIFGHRQSSGNRRNDPGSELYQEVVLKMVKDRGLSARPEFKVGSGLPIPRQWDPTQKSEY